MGEGAYDRRSVRVTNVPRRFLLRALDPPQVNCANFRAMETHPWQSFDPFPDYPALWSLRCGHALVACHRYLLGQFRLQVSIARNEEWAIAITSPEL